MRKKKVLWALLPGLLLAAGCAGTAEKETVPEEKEPLVLEVYAWQDAEAELQALADAYMEKNPQIQIKTNLIPIDEFRSRMLSLKKGRAQADCVFSPSTAEAAIWKNKGMLKNLDGYLEGLDLESHYEQWYEEGMEEIASYMIPYRKSRWAVYYNKDLFDQMGVAYPEEGWTWEDYEETAVRLTGWADGKRTYGSLSFEPSSIWWRLPARTAGANDPFVQSDLRAFRESAEWIYHLTYDLGAQMPYTRQNGSGYDYDGVFLKGNIGMYFSGDWSVSVLNNAIRETGNQIEYDIAPLPHWEGRENYIVSDAAVVSMLETSEHPDEAFDFMCFAAGEEGAGILAKQNIIPAWDSEEVYKRYRDSAGLPEHIDSFFTKGKISMTPSTVRYSEGMEILKDEVASYLMQEQDIDRTFQNVEKKLDELW